MRLTRRELLEEALFAATMAATGGGAALAAEPRETGRHVGPNDRIRIAVIGVRGRGQSHVSAYSHMNDVEVATICDVDLNVVKPALEIVRKAGKPEPKVVQDLRRVIEDPEIDAVSIATCNHWHSLAGIWAMQAGKDVYVEKPVSHNVREGRILLDTSRKYRRICQAGTQIRSNPGSIAAIEYVRSGGIGDVKVARGLCYKRRDSIGKMHPSAVPSGVDYNLWLGPAPFRPFQANKFHYNWHWQWDTGNGDLGNQGIHQMDVARWGLGEMLLPKRVVSLGGRLGYEDDGQTPNTQIAFLDYGERQVIFEVRGLKTAPYRDVMVGNVFHGTDGTVVLPNYDGGAAFDRDGKLVRTFRGGGDHFRNFIDCMRSRKREDQRGEIFEGHVSSAMCHLANVSYRLGSAQSLAAEPPGLDNDEARDTLDRMRHHLAEDGLDVQSLQYRLGRPLTFDPGREQFRGDVEANAMLTRDYREPFVVPGRA